MKVDHNSADNQFQKPWHFALEQAMHAHAKSAFGEAEQLYARILREYPFLSRAAYNLGIARNHLGMFEEAERAFRQALDYEPELFEAALNLAICLQEQGRFPEALNLSAQLVHHWPGIPDSYFIHGCLLLLTGIMPQGWEGYEYRFDCLANPVPRLHLEIPLSDGQPAPGSRLLICAEQGYGDTLQMVRYIPPLIALGLKVWVEVSGPLVSLFEQLPGLEGVIPRGTKLPDLDLQIPIMSLPRQFGTICTTIPGPVALVPSADLVQEMQTLLPANHGLLVGLAWSGRQDQPLNRKRSCPAELFSHLLDVPGITFVNLQKETEAGFNLHDPRLLDFSDKLYDFHYTAALISTLDLVITIDTSVAHLAGTLGKPTWLLLPFVPDWRWLLERTDSPWYPSLRLFRQPARDCWQPVIEQVQQELALQLPNGVDILVNLGVLAESRGRSEEALRLYQAALPFAQSSAVLQYNMGNSHKQLGSIETAHSCYETALQLQPFFPEAHHNLAILAQEQGNYAAAHRHIADALAQRPDFADALHTLGELYQQEERFREAINIYKNALTADPTSVRTWNSLGIVYQCLEQDQDAEPCYRQALALVPEHHHARNNLGALLLVKGAVDESVAELEQLLEQAPDYNDGHWNLACSLLAKGDWQRGWAAFEYRFQKHSPVLLPVVDLPVWDGSDLHGQGILLQGEQAFGDTIQFIRFAAAVVGRGGTVHVACQHPALVSLVAQAKGVTTSVGPLEPVPPDCIYRVPLMSLPHILDLTMEQLPTEVPYLEVAKKQLTIWQNKIPDNSGIRVGLCWSGRQTLRNRRRSCPPELLTRLAGIAGITLFSLQLGGTPPPTKLPLVDLTAEINDFTDSSALLSCLDLVITIDTAVAHLAGALGRPVWLMLPDTVDWRWMADRQDSPWYPTMRIFRQTDSGWPGVLEQVAEKLQQLAAPRLYIYQPGIDFQEPEHLARRLVPLLLSADQTTEGCPAQISSDREQADLYLFPYYLENLTEWTTINGMWHFIEQLPCFSNQESQHVFFSEHDTPVQYQTSAWWFRTSLDPLQKDPDSIPLSYQTEDLSDHLQYDAGKLLYHASFIGYLGHRKQRTPLLAGFARESRLAIFIETTETFHGHQPPEQRAERRRHFLDICVRSLCIICPCGEGSNSIRFFEALALGRLPILISNTPLPFEDSIPYHRFVLRIPPEQAENAGQLLIEWLSGMGDEPPMGRCQEARHIWEQWFSPAALPGRLWTELVRRYCRRQAMPTCLSMAQPAEQSSRTTEQYLQAGLTAVRQEDFAVAEAAFLKASQYNHRCFEAYLELGRLYAATGRYQAAVDRFYEAALIQPDADAPNAEVIPCLERLGRLDEAAYCRKKITDANPAFIPEPDAGQLLADGDQYRENEQWQSALECYQAVLQQAPDNPLARLRAGGCLIFLNRHVEAIPYLLQVTAQLPDLPDAHINLAFCYLALGHWQQGWAEFEWRRKYITEPLPPFEELHRLTPDERFHGRSVLIHTEQGYGDLFQFCRYIPLLAKTGLQVYVTAPSQVVRLLQSMSGVSAVIPHGDSLPNADFQTLLLSLPDRLYEMQPTPLNTVPYLTADSSLQAVWHDRLKSLSGLKIGIAWQGRNMHKSGYQRSLLPEQLAPLFSLPDCSFISLHPQPFTGQIPELWDVSCYLEDFSDTAALISTLDLVITVDTSVAHLSGSLGVPCWVMLLHAPDWRWYPLESDASLWYPTLRLFRQQAPSNWDQVVEQVTASLREELLTRQGHQWAAAGNEAESLACFRLATDHPSPTAAAWLNLGVALYRQGELAESCTAVQQAVRQEPVYSEAWQNLGMAHQALGQVDDAYRCFKQALRLRPDYPAARYNLALLQLLLGNYADGWELHEIRFYKQPPIPQRHTGIPRWHGEPLEGKTLLIHAEQGYGDTIQFLRFVPLLAQTGAAIVLEVQDASLLALARSLNCSCTVITRSEQAPITDLQISLMSIPYLLRTTLDTLPSNIPYLFPATERSNHWKQLLGAKHGLRIGICWKGRDEHLNDRFRSCPLSLLAPLFSIPGIQWYSLQFGTGKEQLTAAGQPVPLIDLTTSITDFHDTAALITQLDLVITVDTSVVHLAGATGCQTWLLSPFAPDWRWGLASNTTPWYPGMRLFRQDKPGNWDDVVERLASALMTIQQHLTL